MLGGRRARAEAPPRGRRAAPAMPNRNDGRFPPELRSVPGGAPCVFLDRDGCVCREAGYINHPDRICLQPGSGAAVRELNRRGILAVLTTNQSGVARGYITEAILGKIHGRLEEQLAARGARLDAVYYAANHPSAKHGRYRAEDGMRKPATGMIARACRRFRIDLSRSYTVGDKITDVEFARNAGVKSVFVLSGYGLGEYEYQRKTWKVQPDHIAEDLRAAARWIISDLKRGRGPRAKRSAR